MLYRGKCYNRVLFVCFCGVFTAFSYTSKHQVLPTIFFDAASVFDHTPKSKG